MKQIRKFILQEIHPARATGSENGQILVFHYTIDNFVTLSIIVRSARNVVSNTASKPMRP